MSRDCWLVVITSGKTSVVHSYHDSMEVAQHWLECKVHDGDSGEIVYMDAQTVEDLSAYAEGGVKAS